MPENLISIGKNAFYGCKFENITLPNTVTVISVSAFEQCKNLQQITIPSSVTVIPERAFFNCTNLKSINLPSSITSVGKNAFYYVNGTAYCQTQEVADAVNATNGSGGLLYRFYIVVDPSRF